MHRPVLMDKTGLVARAKTFWQMQWFALVDDSDLSHMQMELDRLHVEIELQRMEHSRFRHEFSRIERNYVGLCCCSHVCRTQCAASTTA